MKSPLIIFLLIKDKTMSSQIARPPWTKLGKSIESSCRKALYEFEMIDPSTPLCIALSGGKDSLTLLFMLHAISGRGFPPFHLHALHVEEHFSPSGEETRKNLESICHELSTPLIVKSFPLVQQRMNCYVCSRIRRRLLFEAARDLGSSTIAFAHHREDNIQTLIMNLLQKGEFCSMLPKIKMVQYGVTIIRPFIYISEQEIIRFADTQGFLKFSCSCPFGKNTKRKSAGRLLEEMEKEFPRARVNLSHGALIYGSKKAIREDPS
jgi:tRNA 2-thiocytidine biosynthesis protein TtcA